MRSPCPEKEASIQSRRYIFVTLPSTIFTT
jgi:hypothetical protein